MRHWFKPFLLLLVLGISASLNAQIQDPIQWNTYHTPTSGLSVGDEVTVFFEGTIDMGYHIYSAVPPDGMPQLGTICDFDEENRGVEAVGKLLEKGAAETKFDDVFEVNITIYHDKIVYYQKFKITEENPKIAIYLSYQVCNESMCVPSSVDYQAQIKTVKKQAAEPVPSEVEPEQPKEEPSPKQEVPKQEAVVTPPNTTSPFTQPTTPVITETVTPEQVETVVEGSETAAEEAPTVVEGTQASTAKTASEATTEEPIDETQKDKGFWEMLIEGMLFGFGSLLTPCVFPLIPLTVSFFTKQSESRGMGIRNALIYGGSIIFIYTVIGLLVSMVFGADAGRLLAVNPWVNLVIFALLFVFGLSFLGMFEITLPSSWSTNLSNKGDAGGFIGIFLMATVLAIVSFSCVGPIVSVALIRAAESGQLLGPAISMFGFSFALSLPFMVFAAFPGWLNSLPSSGGWLNAVKVVLGLIEVALSLIYFSRADLVMQWGLLDREIFLGAWIVLSVITGIYLLGKLQLPHDYTPVNQISVPRLFLAMGAFWFALYLVPGLWGANLAMLGGYIPPNGKDIGVKVIGGHSSGGASAATHSGNPEICNYPDKVSSHLTQYSHDGFCAFYDLDQGLEYAKKVNKPIFLDFTGITCANCRLLESTVWVAPDIMEMITQDYVLISLYTDDRTKLAKSYTDEKGKKIRSVGDKWIGYQMDKYRSNAQPYYALLDHDLKNLVAPKGFVNPPVDIEEYRVFFRSGLEAFNKK
ncbi:MAG: cytochrome c biogenesis protein CcdA [Bacteroidota bacterium]